MLLSVSQGDCWPPSISGKRTFQCRFILLLVPFFASCSVTRSTSYRLCTLASPRLRRSSPGSWLLFQLYSILWVSVCVDPSTHGRSSFWDCHPSQVFQPHTFPGSAVSVGRLRFHLFQGFSVGGSHLSAAICNRRIYVMRLAYRELVAVASRRSFFTSSPSSGRLAFFLRWLASFLAATWDCSPSSSASIVPGTVRIWGSNLGVDGVSSRSPVVAPSPSSLSRRVSAPSVSCPSLLVRRLGRGLGRPSRLSGRFGPVGHPSGSVVYQCQGTASCSAGAFPVPVPSPRSHSGCLLRRLHSCAFPSQGGCPWSPHHLGSGDLALDGVLLHPPASPVPSGLRHRPNRLPVSPPPAHTSRVVFTHDRLSVFETTVAGSNVFFATSATHHGSIYFSPFRDPWSAGTDAFLQV